MNEDDIKVVALAEKNTDEKEWNLIIKFSGHCLVGCRGRKLLTTDNMLKALDWADYHREGAEHVGHLLRRSGGDISKLPEISGVIFTSSNGEETQP